METKVVNNFREECRIIYQYYRVKIINQTPYLRPNMRVCNTDLETYFVCVERAWKDMNALANLLLNSYPQLQDAFSDVINSYLSRYNTLSKVIRMRCTYNI